MANSTQEVILESFRTAAGRLAGGESAMTESLITFQSTANDLPAVLGGLTQAVENFTGASRSPQSVLSSVTSTITPSSVTKGDSGISVGDVAGTIFKGGLGLVPLVQGIFKLFGSGGAAEDPPVLNKYQAPAPVRVDAALWDGVVGAADYDQSGALRRYAPSSTQESGRPTGVSDRVERSQQQLSTPQQVVNVTVQAMDSQSFLDHSQEIARAVREAMLNTSSLNDVVSEL